jgi:hypothetical protein
MKSKFIRLACVTLLGASATFACYADSVASSASSAGSASVGSLSDSIHGSSNSSGDKKVADGDYQVLEVAELSDRPGILRLRMQAQVGTDNGQPSAFLLDLPKTALAQRDLSAGDIVSVHNRPYGLEFARAQTREAFFLVLNDEWRSDLDARAVGN